MVTSTRRLWGLLVGALLTAFLLLQPERAAWATYSGTSTVTEFVKDGRHYYDVVITETGASSSSEATVANVPIVGTIRAYRATLTAGTGTTIDPDVGRAASFTTATQDLVASNGTAAAHVDNQDAVRYYASTGTLYIHSNANNAATDHSISTEILIEAGWED